MSHDSPKDIKFCNPEFWEKRLQEMGNYENAVQKMGDDWDNVNKAQSAIIDHVVKGRLFDAGCGHGRAVDLIPRTVEYVGMDITPFFIEEAKRRYPNNKFILGDIRNTDFKDKEFDWALAIGMADSIYWPEMEKELIRICKMILVLRCEKPKDYLIISSKMAKLYAKQKQGT